MITESLGLFANWVVESKSCPKATMRAFMGVQLLSPWGNEQSNDVNSPLPPVFQTELFRNINNIRVSAVPRAAAVTLMVHWFIVPVKYKLPLAIVYTQGRKSQYQCNYYYGQLLIKNSPWKKQEKQNKITWHLLMKNTEGKTIWRRKIKIAKIIAKCKKK